MAPAASQQAEAPARASKSSGLQSSTPLSPSPRVSQGRLSASGSGGVADPHHLLDSLDTYSTTKKPASGGISFTDAGNVSSSTGFSGAKTSHKQDGGDVDPIEFLNKHYTSEQVLVYNLPGLREAVTERMQRLDDRISNALQRQSETADLTRRHVQDSRASVEELVHRIHLVQEKASQSEKAVLEITRDMKRMDLAKQHLQRTITTLKRLHMLIHAVEQLRLACLEQPFPDYKTAAHLVDATRLLLKHFDAYTHKVEPMIRLSQKVTDLQEHLRLGVVRGFRIAGLGIDRTIEVEKLAPKSSRDKSTLPPLSDMSSLPPPMSSPVMQGGILLIDALGQEQRRRFIAQFCEDQLKAYKDGFQPTEKDKTPEKRVSSFKKAENPEQEKPPAYGLDQVEKRFLWFRDKITQINKKFPDVFPNYWNLQYSLCRHFLILTREHFYQLLSGPKKDPAAEDATVLLKALQKTIVFEKESMAWLPREFGTVFRSENQTDKDDDVPDSPGGMHILERSESKSEEGINEQKPVQSLQGVASVAFEKHMGPYIALEEQSMDEQLVSAVEDREVDNRGELPVYTSSTALFVYIKGSISRCNAMSKGHAFYLLHQAFQDSIRKYSQVLEGKLPNQQTSSTGVTGGLNLPGFGTSQGQTATLETTYRIPRGEEVTICHVVSTCEYCAETVEALEDLIKDTIDEQYKSKIDMMNQQEVFHEVTARAIRVLVLGLGNRLENAWKMMSQTNWGTFDMVGEESPYCRSMQDEIHPFVTTCRTLLPTPHFRSFCDKFATAFTKTYYNALIRLKRMNEQATQQLLLDVYNLKTLFLKLPILEPKATPGTGASPTKNVVSTIAPAIYTKMIEKQFKKIETLLKLVGTPADLLIDVFKVQWVGGSALDLQTVMSLKGIKRNDQAVILEKFGLDPVTAMKGAHMGVTSSTIVTERLQAVQDRLGGSEVAAKVNSDLSQMRQKVDDFRKSFR